MDYKILNLRNEEVKSLYVHIPFCANICHYCDFCKVYYHKPWIQGYLKQLKKEIDSYRIPVNLNTIYIGGGTPSLLTDDELNNLFEILSPYTKAIKEYTIEVNPETLTLAKARLFSKYGVNRVSLGVQTFNQEVLKDLNRSHCNQDVLNSINWLLKVGINNISIDLIHGFNNTNEKTILNDLEMAISLPIKHISYYSLIIEEHTILHQKNLKEMKQEQASILYDLIKDKLIENGFEHYEISNFAIKGFQSLHNKVYWQNLNYYGVGCGASGYLNNIRYTNTKSINSYLKGKTTYEIIEISKSDQAFEELMLGLRLVDGILVDNYIKKYGQSQWEVFKPTIEYYNSLGLLELNSRVRVTDQGIKVLDTILVDLIGIE
jgi:putative oxygen-independent coproporphyrinogen III oxidase